MAGKNTFALIHGPKFESRLFGEKKSTPLKNRALKGNRILGVKSQHHQNTGGYSIFDFLAVKKTFALIHGSKFESRLFGEKKSVPLKNRAMKGNRLFDGKKSTFSKQRGIKFI